MPKYNLSDKQLNEITDSIIAGQKIQAIKMFVDATGYGLKEAKEEVEALVEALAEEHPEILQRSSRPGSALGIMIVAVIATIAIFIIFFLNATSVESSL